MDDKEGYSSPIAAESVGERLGTPPSATGEHPVRPVVTSSGSGARVADKTAESVGERAGEAYADATTDEARERSRKVFRHAGMRGRSEASQFNQQTLVTVVAALKVKKGKPQDLAHAVRAASEALAAQCRSELAPLLGAGGSPWEASI